MSYAVVELAIPEPFNTVLLLISFFH